MNTFFTVFNLTIIILKWYYNKINSLKIESPKEKIISSYF